LGKYVEAKKMIENALSEVNGFIKKLELSENLNYKLYVEGINYLQFQYYKNYAWTISELGDMKSAINSSYLGIDYIDKIKGYNIEKSTIRGNLAEFYSDIENFKESEKLQIEALEIRKTQNNYPYLFESYYQLVHLMFKLNRKDDLQKYLNEILNLSDSIQSMLPREALESATKMELCQTFNKIMQGRLIDIGNAQEQLIKILNNKAINFELRVDALVTLLDLFNKEFQITKNEESLNRLTKLIEQLWEIGKENNSPKFMSRSLLSQARLLILQGELVKAEAIVSQLKKLGEDHQLEYIVSMADHEVENIKNEYSKWEQLISSNLSIRGMLKQNYITQAIEIIKYSKQ
jgi:tetratricopeptide (TPR) repeat protein